jgi:hypothetical protein
MRWPTTAGWAAWRCTTPPAPASTSSRRASSGPRARPPSSRSRAAASRCTATSRRRSRSSSGARRQRARRGYTRLASSRRGASRACREVACRSTCAPWRTACWRQRRPATLRVGCTARSQAATRRSLCTWRATPSACWRSPTRSSTRAQTRKRSRCSPPAGPMTGAWCASRGSHIPIGTRWWRTTGRSPRAGQDAIPPRCSTAPPRFRSPMCSPTGRAIVRCWSGPSARAPGTPRPATCWGCSPCSAAMCARRRRCGAACSRHVRRGSRLCTGISSTHCS